MPSSSSVISSRCLQHLSSSSPISSLYLLLPFITIVPSSSSCATVSFHLILPEVLAPSHSSTKHPLPPLHHQQPAPLPPPSSTASPEPELNSGQVQLPTCYSVKHQLGFEFITRLVAIIQWEIRFKLKTQLQQYSHPLAKVWIQCYSENPTCRVSPASAEFHFRAIS